MAITLNTNTLPEGPAARVLQAADELFYRKGYGATGVNEIIKTAAVAKASFYQYYPTKLDLIVAYLRHRHANWIGGLIKTVERHPDPLKRLLAVFDFLAEWLEANDYRGCAFLNTIPEFSDPTSVPRQVVREHKQELRDYLAKLCDDAGEPEACDQVFLLVEGAMTQAAVTTDLWPVAAARKLVKSHFEAVRYDKPE